MSKIVQVMLWCSMLNEPRPTPGPENRCCFLTSRAFGSSQPMDPMDPMGGAGDSPDTGHILQRGACCQAWPRTQASVGEPVAARVSIIRTQVDDLKMCENESCYLNPPSNWRKLHIDSRTKRMALLCGKARLHKSWSIKVSTEITPVKETSALTLNGFKWWPSKQRPKHAAFRSFRKLSQ